MKPHWLTIVTASGLVLLSASLFAQNCPTDSTCVSVHRILQAGNKGFRKINVTDDATRTPLEGSPMAIRMNQMILAGDRLDVRGATTPVVLEAKGQSIGEITLPPLSSYRLVKSGCGVAALSPSSAKEPPLIGRWKQGGGWGILLKTQWCMLVHGTEVIVKHAPDGSDILMADGCVEIARVDSSVSFESDPRRVRASCRGPKLAAADSTRIDTLLSHDTLPVSHVSQLALVIQENSIRRLTDRDMIATLAASMFATNHVLGLNFAQRAAGWFGRQKTGYQIGIGVGAATLVGAGIWGFLRIVNPPGPPTPKPIKSTVSVKVIRHQ